MESDTQVQIIFAPGALADILLAIALNPVEISGLASVKKQGQLYLIEDNVIIPPQESSLEGTEFDPDAYGRWIHEMIMNGRGEETGKFKLWWHSHVTARAQFSTTDDHTIESWNETLAEWWISLVGNKYGKFRIRLDWFKPKRRTFWPEHLRFTVPTNKEDMRTLLVAREKKIAATIEKNVLNQELKNPFEKILRGVFP